MGNLLILSSDKKSNQSIVRKLEGGAQPVKTLAFTDGWEALSFIVNEKDVYGMLIDVDNSSCDELRFVKILKALKGDMPIAFMSATGRYAVEAFHYNVVDYLIKPIAKDRLTEAVEKILEKWAQNMNGGIYIKTFGAFEISIKGRPVHWRNSKAKELFAFLVDARGDNVSSEKIQKTLWPGRDIKDSAATFHTTLHQLRKMLERNEIGALLECSRGSQRVNADLFECDFYEFEKEMEKDSSESHNRAFELYKGRYLECNAYTWSHFNRVRLEMLFDKICQSKEYPQ